MDLDNTKRVWNELRVRFDVLYVTYPVSTTRDINDILVLARDLIAEVERLTEINGVLARHGNSLQYEKAKLAAEAWEMKEALESIASGQIAGQTTRPLPPSPKQKIP